MSLNVDILFSHLIYTSYGRHLVKLLVFLEGNLSSASEFYLLVKDAYSYPGVSNMMPNFEVLIHRIRDICMFSIISRRLPGRET